MGSCSGTGVAACDGYRTGQDGARLRPRASEWPWRVKCVRIPLERQSPSATDFEGIARTQPMIKRILVGLGTSRSAESVVKHAIEIAKTNAAELLGVAVTDPTRLEWTGPRPIGVGVEALTT